MTCAPEMAAPLLSRVWSRGGRVDGSCQTFCMGPAQPVECVPTVACRSLGRLCT